MEAGPPERAGTGSVFLRIERPPAQTGRDAAWLIEVDAEGYIPREVGLADDGSPTYVTRPEEYGVWNDSMLDRTPPGTAAFDAQWGRMSKPIPQAEFEHAYAEGDATLPHTIGGTPAWQSDLAAVLIVLVAALLLIGGILLVVRLMSG